MMTWRFDNAGAHRILFVLGNLALCGVVILLVVMPTHAFFAGRDGHIADQRKLLARLTAIAERDASVRSIAADTGAQMQRGEFLSGSNENGVSADLQTRLKAIVDAAGARSRAVQSLPPKTNDQIRYIGSRIEIYGPLPSIHRAIYAVENAKPYLFIAGAVIKVAPSTGRPGVSEEPVIQAQLDIFGAMQPRERTP